MIATVMKGEALASTSSSAHRITEINPSLLRRLCGLLSPKKQEKPPALVLHAPRTPPRPSAASRSSEFEQVFNYFDEDGDGKISPAELRNCMRTVGEELSAEDAETVVEWSDSDGDGLLGFEDFVRLVEVEGEEEKGNNLREAFNMYAVQGQGCITPKSLRRMLRRLGESKSIEECTRMIHRFDINGDGVLSFEEFRSMML